MRGTLRVILDLEGAPAVWQMAVDEALLRLRSMGRIPDTLRIYRFRPHAVTIGRFQRLESSVDLEEARKLGIDVVRRFTGGGSVYHDTDGEVTYSIVLGLEGRPELRDVAMSYRVLCRGVVEALRILGVEAEYKPINDVVAGGRKVSGNAQARTATAVLQHGTVLYATNLDVMERVLRVPRAKLESHGALRIRDRVATLSQLLGRELHYWEVAVALVEGFRIALGYDAIRIDALSGEEKRLAEQLAPRYASREWLYRR
ncbi:lipoate--protein ligase family protein [Hyperthermus butylicus]|uniref:Lipoate-protein ligase A n=1 Tax=Hyperthermus butylicus (strain DSM 5456 / JCM 9403 / PLM1-5) TaxID=415426 RepID=A2BKZ3_HYPBU|nr:biotin/lipoate A/B protein ligase family protein [Hyperthermus butylicus]ABM80654.1 Lipoate-protein ligase A [Hyperthermus butylicus DSM 5456]